MRISSRWLWSFGLIAVALTLAFVAQTRAVLVASSYFEGAASSFRYTGQGQSNGSYYVTISVDFDDPIAHQGYLDANRQRGQALLSRSAMYPLPLQITLATPVSLPDARTLVSEAHVQVDSFAFVGRSSLNRSKRGGHWEFGGLDQTIPETQSMDPAGVNGEQLVLEGVMVIHGTVADAAGLASLLDDPRIYLVDTSEVELRTLIVQRHQSEVASKDLTISVPSPFWNLDW